MKYTNNKVENLKIAYIGGGSRGWAWGLMSDLAQAEDLSGDVYLYDIDHAAAKNNEIVGNRIRQLPECKAPWNYHAVETNAVFRVDSLQPVMAGNVPSAIAPMIARASAQQELVAEAARVRDLKKAFAAFAADPLVRLPIGDARKLFQKMADNTKNI